MSTNLEKCQTPVDWLAARGLTSKVRDEPDVYTVIGWDNMQHWARQYKRHAGISYSQALEAISKALGFDRLAHYQEFRARRGEHTTSAQRMVDKNYRKAQAKLRKERGE